MKHVFYKNIRGYWFKNGKSCNDSAVPIAVRRKALDFPFETPIIWETKRKRAILEKSY